jgi:hypothetical protein
LKLWMLKTNSTKLNGKEREDEGEQLALLSERILNKIKYIFFLTIRVLSNSEKFRLEW